MSAKLAAKSEVPSRTAHCPHDGRMNAQAGEPVAQFMCRAINHRETYWLECEIDPTDRNRLREPPPYDLGLVSNRRAKKLGKARRFRAPRFPRQRVLQLWRESRVSATAATETNPKTFLANCLRANPQMKRDDALTACQKEFPTLSKRGFRERVWPDAREEVKMERRGRPGRKPTGKIQTS